jgi:hypothetical protein
LNVRVLGAPGRCTGAAAARWQSLRGKTTNLEVSQTPGTLDGLYFVAARGIDFGSLEVETSALRAEWYDCPGGSDMALWADPARRHFVLRDGGQPLVAWSKLPGR